MKTGILLLSGLIAVQLVAQVVDEPDTTTTEDPPMLLGIANRDELQQEPFSAWFNKEYEAYTLQKEILATLKTMVDGVGVEIYLGTWCSDSRREVPRIYKILDYLGLESGRIKVLGLDRGKESPNHDEEGMNIHHVPTIVFYHEGVELGRIIETPIKSLEEDLQAILTGEVYIPNYMELE